MYNYMRHKLLKQYQAQDFGKCIYPSSISSYSRLKYRLRVQTFFFMKIQVKFNLLK